MKYSFNGGKYTVEFDEATGQMHALRHGEPWQDLTGNGMVLSMLQRVDAQVSLLERAEKLLDEVEAYVSEDDGSGLLTSFMQEVRQLSNEILMHREYETDD